MIWRPIQLLLVVAVQIIVLYCFRSDVLILLDKVKDYRILTGLAPLALGAPSAFMLWSWRDSDKQKELKNSQEKLELDSKTQKMAEERWLFESEKMESERTQNRIEADRLRIKAEKLQEDKLKEGVDKSSYFNNKIITLNEKLMDVQSKIVTGTPSPIEIAALKERSKRISMELSEVSTELKNWELNRGGS